MSDRVLLDYVSADSDGRVHDDSGTQSTQLFRSVSVVSGVVIPMSDASEVTGPSAPEPAQLDTMLERLRGRARAFAHLPPSKKADLLREVRQRFFELADKMVELGNRAKSVALGSPQAGEEWFSGPAISLRALRLFEASLSDIAKLGSPVIRAEERGRTRHGRGVTH